MPDPPGTNEVPEDYIRFFGSEEGDRLAQRGRDYDWQVVWHREVNQEWLQNHPIIENGTWYPMVVAIDTHQGFKYQEWCSWQIPHLDQPALGVMVLPVTEYQRMFRPILGPAAAIACLKHMAQFGKPPLDSVAGITVMHNAGNISSGSAYCFARPGAAVLQQ